MEQMLELMKYMQEEMRTHGSKMDASTKANQEIRAGQEQMKETMERQMGSLVSRMEGDTKTNRDEMKEEIVKLIEGWKKKQRIQNLAVERLQKLKERTQGYCGSWKRETKLASIKQASFFYVFLDYFQNDFLE
jgi:hypothetical protein